MNDEEQAGEALSPVVGHIRRGKDGMNAIKRSVVGLFLLTWGSLVNAGNNEVTVNTSILQGTCAVSVMNNGEPVSVLALGNIESSQLAASSMAGFKPVVLSLSNCGLAAAGQAPFVKLGGSFAQGDDVTGADGKYMFRKQGPDGGDSHGYFIFVANTVNPVWAPVDDNGQGDGVYGSDKPIPIPMGAAGTAEGTAKTVYLGVGCGGNCGESTTRGGSVQASLEFTFSYQ